jgi:hypothetical protein
MRGLALVLVMAACARPGPVTIRYGRMLFGHAGPLETLGLEVSRSCKVTLTEPDRLPRRGTLERADCDELFAAAASARVSRAPTCTYSQSFQAGVEVRLSDGTELHGCGDDALAARVARVAERYGPALRRTAPPEGLCDPIDCPSGDPSEKEIGGVLSKPEGCTEWTSRECRRRADASCGWVLQHTRHCAVP